MNQEPNDSLLIFQVLCEDNEIIVNINSASEITFSLRDDATNIAEDYERLLAICRVIPHLYAYDSEMMKYCDSPSTAKPPNAKHKVYIDGFINKYKDKFIKPLVGY